MNYKKLKGICKNCLGCNRLEDINFEGVYRCEYATDKQIDVEDLRKDLQNDNTKDYK